MNRMFGIGVLGSQIGTIIAILGLWWQIECYAGHWPCRISIWPW